MRHWLCISGYHNWIVINQRNVWGVDERYKLTMERNVSFGDEFCFYVKPDNRAHSPYRDESKNWKSSITGIFRVKKHNEQVSYFEEMNIGWIDPKGNPKTYPYRVDLEKLGIAKVPVVFSQQLKEELLFITDKSKSWGPFVFPSMVLLPKEDMATFRIWIQRTWK